MGTGKFCAHEIEVTIEMNQRTLRSCTDADQIAYLEQFPESALAKIYDLDLFDRGLTNDEIFLIDRLRERVTTLLLLGKIPHPSQSLGQLSDWLQERVFDNLQPQADLQ